MSYVFLINFWSLLQVQSYMTLSIINYGVSKYYAGSMVSDRCTLGSLFQIVYTRDKLIRKKQNIRMVCAYK